MRWSRRNVLAGLGAAPILACAASNERRPPRTPTEIQVRLPPVVEQQRAEGPRVLVIEDHSLPLVSLVLALPAGYRHEPLGQEGVATLAASMVLEGIAGGDRINLLAQYGDLGGTPSANAGASLLTLHCTVQRDQAPQALRLMARTLLESTLDPETLERIRRELRGWFAVNRGEPSAVTGLGLLAGAFDLHPSVAALGYGTPQTLDQLDREAVRTYLQTHLRLDDAVFLLSGDLSESEAGQWVDAASQGWRQRPRYMRSPTIPLAPAWCSSPGPRCHRPSSPSAAREPPSVIPTSPPSRWPPR